MAGEINKRLEEIAKDLDPVLVAKLAYPVFYSNTPRRTGNAQNHTKVRQNMIEADYPYAQRLDNGYSSLKPQGMTKPTIKWFKDYIRRIKK
jgi:hypothetical protein